MTLKTPIIKFTARIWTSPTFTTWGHLATRSFNLIFVLPLIVTRLEVADISMWYLFRGIMDIQILADLGFEATFSRVIAYAMGGVNNLKDVLATNHRGKTGSPNWNTLERICSTMNGLYPGLSLASFSVFALLGSLALRQPISITTDSGLSWLSWGIVLITSTVYLYGTKYSALLQGVDQIALYRRWLALSSIGEIITSIVVLLLNGGLLGLVIANQSWRLISVLLNRRLCMNLEDGRFASFKRRSVQKEIFRAVWPSAWRSGVGRFMSFGLVQITGFIFAQIGSASEIASYVLALRFIQIIVDFSRAPFYSKLPSLARLLSEGKRKVMIDWAHRGMVLSFITYVSAFIGLSIVVQPFLTFIGSNVDFIDPLLWSLLGLGIFFERYGAMHIQLYSVTNKIIWHIANGVSGLIFLAVSLFLYNSLGTLAFPIGYIAGYLGFYAWYSAKHSYREFRLRFWEFETKSMLIPLMVMLAHLIWSLYMRA